MDRFKTQFLLSDIVRIDHFRGLESYWEIPADSETALNGKWVDGPKDDFFETLIQSFWRRTTYHRRRSRYYYR